jgi:AcrR family transcriptional regulator
MARDRKFSTEDLYRETRGILLQYGYEAFTFSILADRLNVSRGAIYKYFDKKEDLITDYMLYELNRFMKDIEKVSEINGFEEQLEYILEVIFKHGPIHQIAGYARHVPADSSEKVKANIKLLEDFFQHQIYYHFQSFIDSGRKEHLLNPKIPDSIILGMIFQTVRIPEHASGGKKEWIAAIKEMICHGIYKKD